MALTKKINLKLSADEIELLLLSLYQSIWAKGMFSDRPKEEKKLVAKLQKYRDKKPKGVKDGKHSET